MYRTVRITERDLVTWRQSWPCSTLVTGWAQFAPNGDLVDLGGKLSRANVDSRELTAFCNDRLPVGIA